MKKLPLVLLTCFILLGLLSCSNSSGGGGDSSYEETNKSTFSVTNLTFIGMLMNTTLFLTTGWDNAFVSSSIMQRKIPGILAGHLRALVVKG